MYYNTKYTKKTKARFSRLLWHSAWKWRGPILISALHIFVLCSNGPSVHNSECQLTQVVLHHGHKMVAVGHNLSQICTFDEVYNICASWAFNQFISVSEKCYYSENTYKYKNSSGDERANVNFFYDDTLHALQNIVRCWIFNTTQAAGRLGSGAASGRGRVVLLRRFSHAPICCNEVRFEVILPEYHLTTGEFLTLTPSLGVIHCKYRHN